MNCVSNCKRMKGNRLTEALESYRAAIGHAPQLGEAYNNLGNTLRKLDQNADALAAFEDAARLRPTSPLILNISVPKSAFSPFSTPGVRQ